MTEQITSPEATPAPATAPVAAKVARTPIPAGMTRSRGALIPVSTGRCAFTGVKGQCANPGRWPITHDGQKVQSCTTHKNAAKRSLFAPVAKARKARAAKVVATAAA